MSGVKAKLKIVLQADETIVAESEDPALWQRVLLAINGDPARLPGGSVNADREQEQQAEEVLGEEAQDVQKLANMLGVSASVVEGACAPAKISPFLSLDMHCWNAMKEQTPAKGVGSMTSIGVAGTLLALWCQSAKLGSAKQVEVHKILRTVNVQDKNPTRSIQSSDWLQSRTGGVILVNPARLTRAIAIAKAFCSKDWRSDLTWKGNSAE
jgi:hypothetical protein